MDDTEEARDAHKGWLKRIGDSVRLHRDLRGLTQGALASLVGVDISTISKTELAKTEPELATLEAIANVLFVSLDDLVGRTPLTEATQLIDFGDAPTVKGSPQRAVGALEAALDLALEEIGRLRDRVKKLENQGPGSSELGRKGA